MKRLVTATALLLAASICMSESASAHQPGGFGGFLPYGFYQPYGARYGNSVQTPPYFAINPPVYYGARYARPYGMSPFAAPPQVNVPAGYRGRLQTSTFQTQRAPIGNPYICSSRIIKTSDKVASKGEVQSNPFVSATELVAKH